MTTASKQKVQAAVSVIVPPVVVHHLDPHTGIPFMPHMAAYLAGALRECGYPLQVFDCFGMQPNQRQIVNKEFMLLGLPESEIAVHLNPAVKVCFIYCRTMAEFIAIERMAGAIRKRHPDVKICLFENIQAVTSFSLQNVANELLNPQIDVLVMGEPETRACALVESLLAGEPLDAVPGLAYRGDDGEVIFSSEVRLEEGLDELAMPAWDLFPLEGYWTAGFAHAPCGNGKFLPLLTSRGCPFKCKFCLSPFVNPRWRSRSAVNVVDEIEHFAKTLGVRDFHISDLNPTVSDKRTREICGEILKRGLSVTWKLAQGTKIETIKNEETLELMARAGCRFVAFSPETGSRRLLKKVNKPFDFEHGLRMVRKMNELGIRTQACFLAGLPGEEEADRRMTLQYVKKLIAAGVDEISCYIFTPVPGSELSRALEGYDHYSQCTPSPNWRSDYKEVLAFRHRMYRTYFLYKLTCPRKVLREIWGLLTGRFQTKMEMSLFKQVKLFGLRYCPGIFRRRDSSAELDRLA